MRLECPPIPRQRTEDHELARLSAEHPEWEIRRQTDHGGAPGAWHAVRRDPRPALQGLRYQTAGELHTALEAVSAR